MQIKNIRFMIWSGQEFGGLERRYLRIIQFLSNKNQFILSLVYLKRSSIEINSHVSLNNIHQTMLGKQEFNSRILNYVFNIINFYEFIKSARTFDGEYIVFCGNPGFIAGILSIFKKRRQKLIVPNAMLHGDQPMKFIDKFGIMLMNFGGATIDHLSDEPYDYFYSVNTLKTNKIKNLKAPCSFTDFNKVEKSKHKDIDISMIARFVENKGYDLLEDINDGIKKYNVHCCGFGPKKITLPNAIVYKTNNPYNVLSRTKIFLSIQRDNNYPSQSLLEAMASGCAIIATDVGETRKILDETCSILIPYCSKKLIESIMILIENEDLRIKLGAEAEKRVKKFHTVDVYGDYFESYLLA